MISIDAGVGSSQKTPSAIPVPALRVDEQVRVRDSLAKSRRRTDALTQALARQILLLQERKQALITAAVTGQLNLAHQIAEEAS